MPASISLERRLSIVSLGFLLLKVWKWLNKRRFKSKTACTLASDSNGKRLWENFQSRKQSFTATCSTPRIGHVTLAGGGFRTISYVGQVFFLHVHRMLDKDTCFYGTSLGAFFAVVLAFETAGVAIRDRIVPGALDYCIAVRRHPLQMWGLLRSIFRRLMLDHFPDDISIINGRAHVSITLLFPYPHNCMISEFHGKMDLIDCILSSMHIPMWTSGFNPVSIFRGRLCLDGGLTMNEPVPLGMRAATAQSSIQRLAKDLFPSAASLQSLPTNQAERHYKCKEHAAPLWQVFCPPPEHEFLAEMQRGWNDAQKATELFRAHTNSDGRD